MFGNRLFYAKLATGLALFVGLCWYAHVKGLKINPGPGRARLLAPRYDGSTLWIPMAEVAAVSADRIVVQTNRQSITVVGQMDGIQPGDMVELTGSFRSEGPTLFLVDWRRLSPPGWRRRIVEIVSVFTFAGVALLFLRRFSVRKAAVDIPWQTS